MDSSAERCWGDWDKDSQKPETRPERDVWPQFAKQSRVWRRVGRLHRHENHFVERERSPRFVEIERAIEASRTVVDLPEDWDEAGAKQIPQETWDLASEALREAARTAYRRHSYTLPAPTIGPCADGSIDLYWTTPKFTLLINVMSGEGDFYAERPDAKMEGLFNPNKPNFDFLSLLVKP
jgi:hypothetical protein